ncbi:MAG TPA: CBS domain-containing protein [Microlunatus sp.]|nr:CBS domain-containing protein [Microlunatus sp.]
MRVHDVLVHKGSAVATIGPGATVAEVLDSLDQHGIGALVVTSNGTKVEGIISERDIVRALKVHGADLLGMRVVDVMRLDVPTCVPDDQISSLARTMTEKRYPHLPVVVNGVLCGIVSLGDVVKSRVDELETEQNQLVDYLYSAR